MKTNQRSDEEKVQDYRCVISLDTLRTASALADEYTVYLEQPLLWWTAHQVRQHQQPYKVQHHAVVHLVLLVKILVRTLQSRQSIRYRSWQDSQPMRCSKLYYWRGVQTNLYSMVE